MILAVSIVVWAALYYPAQRRSGRSALSRPNASGCEAELAAARTPTPPARGSARPSELAEVDREIAGAYQRQSLLGRLGRLDRAGLPAAGLGLADRLRGDRLVPGPRGRGGHAGRDLQPRRRRRSRVGRKGAHAVQRRAAQPPPGTAATGKVFNLPVALSIMVFFALCAQCAATLAVIRRETNSWRWPLFTFAYMTTLAYLGALVTYQVGMWIGGWAT